MKLKDDIKNWKEKVAELETQTAEFESKMQSTYDEVKDLKEKVETLTSATNEMTEALLALIRQQMSD